MNRRKKIILGVFDSLSSYLCSNNNVDYVWASSFILSTVYGNKDTGIVQIRKILPMLCAIVKSSRKPVILDFDVGGRNIPELRRNLLIIKNLNLGGVCIEDEKWPKINAMHSRKRSNLISPEVMSKKIKYIRKILGKNFLIIARTHSFIENEPINILQKRLDQYAKSGANVLCIHYTGNNWRSYRDMLSLIKVSLPVLLILSKREKVPNLDKYDYMIKYILFPNQVYRMVVSSIEKLLSVQVDMSNEFKCSNTEIVLPKKIFKLIDIINIRK